MKGARVARGKLSLLKSDLRGRGRAGAHPGPFRVLSARLRRRGNVKYLGIFVRVKGIASVVSRRFKPAVLTKEESDFT